ncbi:hypothetical protein OSTOST_09027, partial [Ostertagia ostertagi]
MIGLTLFVGVVIANYTENRGTALLTVDQRRWHDLKARLKMAQPLHVPPKPSESARLGTVFYELTLSRRFSQVFAFLVLLNSACLVVPWNVEEEGERSTILFAVTALSAVINILFAVEIILKVLAFTFAGFWQSRRNRIDLLITVFGLLWIFLHFFVAVPSSSFDPAPQKRLKTFHLHLRLYHCDFAFLHDCQSKFDSENADAHCCDGYVSFILHHHRDVPLGPLLRIYWRHSFRDGEVRAGSQQVC